jgi:hypothetical protein
MRNGLVPDRIDATMKPVKTAGTGLPADRIPGVAQRFELSARNDPVLILRQLSDCPVRSPFVAHALTKGELGRVLPLGERLFGCLQCR